MLHKILVSSYRPVLALAVLGLIALLSACTSESKHILWFTEIAVSPEPLIGQVSTLHLEFVSDYDQSLVTVDIYLPEGIKLIEGDLTWKGSLTAAEPQTHDILICAEHEGEWHINITGRVKESESYTGFLQPRSVILYVTQTNALIFGDRDNNYNDFRLTQPTPTFGPTILHTPLPADWVSPCP